MLETSRIVPLLMLGAAGALGPGCGDGAAGTGGGGAASTGQGGGGAETTSSSMTGTGGAGGTGSTGGAGGASAVPVTLLTLNLHCFQLGGTSFASNTERFAAITAFAVERGVDVMTVQEACQRPGEDAILSLREALSEATGPEGSSVWAFAHVAWEGTPDEADEGVGLLIRGDGWSEVAVDHAVQSALHRVAVSARLPPELGGARVMSIHFDVFDAEARSAQAREAAAAAIADSEPAFDAIVAGDFNDVEGSPAWSAFPAMGYLPANEGLAPAGIDHVMIHRAAPLRPVSAEEVLTGTDAVSDHPGILVRFEPAAGDAVTATRIFTEADPGSGHFLSVRGDTAPLSWDFGVPMRPSPPDGHFLVLTEIQGAFQFKLLRDDTVWQQGENETGNAGEDLTVTPAF